MDFMLGCIAGVMMCIGARIMIPIARHVIVDEMISDFKKIRVRHDLALLRAELVLTQRAISLAQNWGKGKPKERDTRDFPVKEIPGVLKQVGPNGWVYEND